MSDGWAQLLDGLRGLGDVEEVAPGRTVVRYDGRSVTIVMTRRQWIDLWGVVWGDLESALESTLRSLRELPDVPYAVYDCYELHPSPTPELPPDPEEERIEQWLRDHPGQFGTWSPAPRDPLD